MNLNLSNPLEIIILLVVAGLLPYLAVLMSSFARIIIVLGLLRNALGLQTTPPNIVLNGLALIVSIYIMNPVLTETYEAIQYEDLSKITIQTAPAFLEKIKPPFQKFLTANSSPDTRQLFLSLARKTWPDQRAATLTEQDMVILVPAFITTEVSLAFQIGFIIYLPFVIVDLVVSNILLALGMVMISPTTISLPFKLLLLTLVNGWGRLFEGLVLSYRY